MGGSCFVVNGPPRFDPKVKKVISYFSAWSSIMIETNRCIYSFAPLYLSNFPFKSPNYKLFSTSCISNFIKFLIWFGIRWDWWGIVIKFENLNFIFYLVKGINLYIQLNEVYILISNTILKYSTTVNGLFSNKNIIMIVLYFIVIINMSIYE